MVLNACSTVKLVKPIAFLANMRNCKEIRARRVEEQVFSRHVTMRCGNIIQNVERMDS